MQIEKKNVSQLLPADYNPRKDLKPGDKEYEKLKRSIEQFGYVEPVIWNATTSRVVGGHQRLKVLIDMGITEVECVIVEMGEEKEKALNVALNKISGEWDNDKLALLIADLQGADFDVSLPVLSQKNWRTCLEKIQRKVFRMMTSMWMPSFQNLPSPRLVTCGSLVTTVWSVVIPQSLRPMSF